MNSSRRGDTDTPERCLYCGNTAGIVWVHGHGQCTACGTNVEECCRGENCSAWTFHRRKELPETVKS